MKKLLVVIAVVSLFCSFGFAQTWTFDSDWLEGPQPHGIVIDNAGLIWVGWYAYTDTLGMPADTVPVAPVYAYNPDGTQAAFSPIYTLTVDGVTDTMNSFCRGLSLDHNGNVIFVGNQVMYRINSLTGEGMNKYLYPASGSLTSAGVDANGYIYVTKVVPGGGPFVILDEDFDPYGFVLDSCFTIQRSVVVSDDGNDVYLPIIYAGGNEGIIHYHSDFGPDGPYVMVDTLYRGQMWGQAADWDRNGLMWVGSYWDCGADDFGGWYALDPTQNFGIVDTVVHYVGNRGPLGVTPPPGAYVWAPRHAAWSLDGQTMYTNDFDGGVIKKWTNASPIMPGGTVILSVNFTDNKQIAVEFELAQNYPNPFNPTTQIPFEIKKKFHVKLVIFDMLGRQIATLVDDELAPKRYEFTFDGSNLSSGTYFYQLSIDGSAQTKQMLLVK